MNDIVDRLRDVAGFIQKEHGRVAAAACLATEAADIIQSLREKTQYWPDNAERDAVIRYQKEEIERLRAENFSLAAWQCEFTDGKTGLVAHEHGGTYCAMAKENERLRAVLHDINMTTRCDKTAVKARAALKPSKD